MERKTFGEPVQTATVVGAAYGIHRTTLTQAAKAGVLGGSAYRSGDAWLIKTDHEDFWEWLREHEYHPRVKGYRKQQAARAAQQTLLLEDAERREDAGERTDEGDPPMASREEQREPAARRGVPVGTVAQQVRHLKQEGAATMPVKRAPERDAPRPGGDVPAPEADGAETAVRLAAADPGNSGAPSMQEGPVVAQLSEEGEVRAETEPALGVADIAVSPRRRRRLIAYVDVRRGEGMTDTGESFPFGAQASLLEVLASVPLLG